MCIHFEASMKTLPEMKQILVDQLSAMRYLLGHSEKYCVIRNRLFITKQISLYLVRWAEVLWWFLICAHPSE